MKHNKLFYLTLVASLSMLTACSSDIDVIENNEGDVTECNQITMTAPAFINGDDESRSTVDITNTGVNFLWAANDTVGIFPEKGAQAYFPMIEGAGTSSAKFTGGGWALKPSARYGAYYPYNFFNRNLSCIPVNYDGQTQNGFNSTEHIGKYDYMISKAKTPTDGNINFEFIHLGCLVELNMVLPKSEKYIAVLSLYSIDNSFDTSGTISLNPGIGSNLRMEKYTNKFVVNLKNCSTTSDNTPVKVYFMIPPMNFEGTTIHVDIDSHYHGQFEGKNFIAGHAYKVDAGTLEDYEWIDLGLSVKWASRNLGAKVPSDEGNHFAWAEIKPFENKSEYIYENIDEANKLNNISGHPKYDAARAILGSPARIPTKDEWNELFTKCTIIEDGYYGYYKVIGPNGNSILLNRTTGEKSPYHSWNYSACTYWTSTPVMDGQNISADFAYKAWFYNHGAGKFETGISSINKYMYMAIRPVCDY